MMQSVSTTAWFLLNRGRISGPFEYDTLVALRANRQCTTFSQVSCDRRNWTPLDEFLGRQELTAITPPPQTPPPAPGVVLHEAVSGAVVSQQLFLPFPIPALLALHFFTGGAFSFFWLLSRHGRLPEMRADDPSGAKAIGLCCVPFYNLYWLFHVFHRLGQRLSALARQGNIDHAPSSLLTLTYSALIAIPLATCMAGLVVLGFLSGSVTPKTEAIVLFFVLPHTLTLINYLFVGPVFAASTQRVWNRIGQAQLVQLQTPPASVPAATASR